MILPLSQHELGDSFEMNYEDRSRSSTGSAWALFSGAVLGSFSPLLIPFRGAVLSPVVIATGIYRPPNYINIIEIECTEAKRGWSLHKTPRTQLFRSAGVPKAAIPPFAVTAILLQSSSASCM